MRKTPITTKKEIYSDFYKDFTQNPVSLDLARKTNVEAVKESIKNLILTDQGERLFQPTLGTKVRALLFDNLTPDLIISIRELVKDTITNYEPRAELIDVDVTSAIDSNDVKITIIFTVINIEEPIALAVTLTRVR